MAKIEPAVKDQPWSQILASGTQPEETSPVPHFDTSRYVPGTFGCHEAMHESMLIQEMLSKFAEHPAIRLRPEWRVAALHASYTLQNIYQSISREHVGEINKRASDT